MNSFELKHSQSPERHIHAGHDVIVRVVGAEEHVVCLTCDNLILERTPIPNGEAEEDEETRSRTMIR